MYVFSNIVFYSTKFPQELQTPILSILSRDNFYIVNMALEFQESGSNAGNTQFSIVIR